jgi:oligopeptide/dipeptide ABC transporter ATP-binding protein
MSVIETTPTGGHPPLLEVRDLKKEFPVKLGFRTKGVVSAVDGVSFKVEAGETLGIVGESGCGKSTAARLLLGLLEPDAGEVGFEGQNVAGLGRLARKQVRRQMQMVFQDPYSSLNPRMSIRDNIGFPMKVHGYGKKEIADTVAALLEDVGLHKNHASYFPHQMSGGQRQRVNIARALALNPKLIVCDEAVSALDKSIQAQVLNLLQDLQQEHNLTYLFISHDLNVVEYISDRVVVMYLGQVVETCPSDELYRNPLHPYTKALLSAIPKLDPDDASQPLPISGELPSPINPPSGCRFRTRCPMAMEVCATARPKLTEVAPGHQVACYLYEAPAATASLGLGPTATA